MNNQNGELITRDDIEKVLRKRVDWPHDERYQWAFEYQGHFLPPIQVLREAGLPDNTPISLECAQFLASLGFKIWRKFSVPMMDTIMANRNASDGGCTCDLCNCFRRIAVDESHREFELVEPES